VVGGGEVCDACVVAVLSGGTEEIAKFWYRKLETCPEIAGMGIYLKTSGPSFFDADFSQRMRGWVERGSRLRLPKQADDRMRQGGRGLPRKVL